ncbi:TraR/DksA family transcriptional regulator [Acinetobacter baumannii]
MNGWGPSDPVFETNKATIDDAIEWARLELELSSLRESSEYCEDCGEDIPEKRREFVKGVRFCIECQPKHEAEHKSYYNRRGSKDSQLR